MTTGTAARIFVIFASLLAAPLAAADWPADEAAIRQALDASDDAFNRGDLKGHLAIYDDSVEFMTKDGPRPGIAGIEKSFSEHYFRDGKAIQQLHVDRLAVRPLTDDTAIATARWALSGGGLPDQSGWFTLVFLRTPAGWRAVHDHSS